MLNNKKTNTKSLIGLSALLLIILAASSTFVSAAPPVPSSGTATVDGTPSEWDLTNDFFAGMYNGWDASKNLEAKAYIRYDVATHTLYVLVLAQPGYVGLVSHGDAWVAISTADDEKTNNKVVLGSSCDKGMPPDFAWVGQGYE